MLTAAKISSGEVVKSLNGLTDAVTLSAGPNVTLTRSGNDVQISAAVSSSTFTWQTVAGTAQQAQPNTGYIANDPAQVTITLPAAPDIGTRVRVVGAGSGGWQIAQNAGQSIRAGNTAFAANSIGVSWVPHGITANWEWVGASSDGTKLVAVGSGTQIYTSSLVSVPGATTTPPAGSLLGNQGAAIELVYVGNNQFLPLSFVPTVLAY